MVERNYEQVGNDVPAIVSKFVRAKVSLNDYLSFSNDFSLILQSSFLALSGGSSVTTTISGNTSIYFTTAGTNYMVSGQVRGVPIRA